MNLVTDAGGVKRLRIEYVRRTNGILKYVPQFGSDLAAGGWINAQANVAVTPISTDWERCVVEDPVTMNESTRRFGRVALNVLVRDADGDGFNRTIEETMFGTSDAHFDDFTTFDGDGDGLPSVIEAAFNLDPLVAGKRVYLVSPQIASSGLPSISLETLNQGQTSYLQIGYLRRKDGLFKYRPQFGSGLNADDWEDAKGAQLVVPVNAQWEIHVVDDTVLSGDVPRRFGRVGVSW